MPYRVDIKWEERVGDCEYCGAKNVKRIYKEMPTAPHRYSWFWVCNDCYRKYGG